MKFSGEECVCRAGFTMKWDNEKCQTIGNYWKLKSLQKHIMGEFFLSKLDANFLNFSSHRH